MKQDNYKMDSRNLKEIQNQIENLAAGYVPEWNFDVKNPDISSVLAMIFAGQMENNIDRFNHMLECYHKELVNLMEISPIAAHPAKTTLVMDMKEEVQESLVLPKGSQFVTETDGIVFETAFPIVVTPAKLKTIFMTAGADGKLKAIKGKFKEENYIETREKKLEEEPFSLFQFAEEDLERQAVVLYHNSVFDVEDETIYCRIQGAPELPMKIAAGEFRFLYYTEEGFLPIENCHVLGEEILLVKEKANKPISIDGNSYSIFVLEARKPQKEKICISSVSFASTGSPRSVEYVGNGTNDFSVDQFRLFGDTLSVGAKCYIGFDRYFAKKGAKICLNFKTSIEEHYVGQPRQEEKPILKLIKRKPRKATVQEIVSAYPQEITVEYYNGIGWKRLSCEQEYKNLFEMAEEKEQELKFCCPKDWEEVEVGAYKGRMLRIQLMQAKHCDFEPCIHKVPVISKLRASYSYEDNYKIPQMGKVFSGTDVEDITKKMQENQDITLFSPCKYEDTALYLGFDRKLTEGPVSLWFEIEEVLKKENAGLKFYYSSLQGFKEIKVMDETNHLTRSGLIMFFPPADMEFMELEGNCNCWLKIAPQNEEKSEQKITLKQLALNGVTAYNVETLPMQDFYLEEEQRELILPLSAEGILDAEVLVNEIKEFSQESMEKMLEDMPEKIRITRNYRGEISEFFVKWEETQQLYNVKAEDRFYILDRINKKLLFGNGTYVKVPQNTDGVAFRVQLRCCSGKLGNVQAGAIKVSKEYPQIIEKVYNPQAAFGGSDMESKERLLRRSVSMFSSGGYLVTAKDYEREILHFSDIIDKVAIVGGMDKDGVFCDEKLNIVLLLKEENNGKEAFCRMQKELKEHLLKQCELSIAEKDLQIVEPVFVTLDVDVWASVAKMEDKLEIQSITEEILKEYLNPVACVQSKGWKIGVLPGKSQIMMRLSSLKRMAQIHHIVVTAKYEDKDGRHETDIEDLKITPFMVVMNGTHKVHIT